MSYEEKGAWVYLVASLGTYACYVVLLVGRWAGDVGRVPYVATMLWAIGVGVGVSVVGRVLVEVLRPSERHRGDARDREINRLGEYVGGLVLGIAMTVPFALVLLQAHRFWIANGMYAAFVLAAAVGTVVKLVAYRRGL
ncbi:hypothetical protein [Actinokineospora sp. NBRC 105648]|uniref:hypothetical protein n=1 Tax=Actinokineospora sp. NBRC 105648 TaxID=3032206 RepID=UPI0024A4630C|nr:hypothetical protein [Actinokineospora sp. NBRC 105648]GLZ40448.1 hypothetical protein Acsp05_40720 [Actinokineospora sp. NBRC 105648]